jgi:valyl-tRNA synthetase
MIRDCECGSRAVEWNVGCNLCDVCYLTLFLQGLIDIKKEVSKLDDKRSKLNVQLKKLFETINGNDYVSKVPENVRNQNSEKVM